MVYLPATKLIKCDKQKEFKWKWSNFVDGGNGCMQGIPKWTRRVLQFNVEDKTSEEIGPDLGDGKQKYWNGIKALFTAYLIMMQNIF